METQVDNKSQKLTALLEQINDSEISSTQRVITEIIRVINDPHSTAKDLKEIIDVDPPLAGKVLRRANSAYYANRRKFSDILEAIIWVGFDAVKQLALSQKVCELFEQEAHIEGYSRLALWKHSVAVALCSKFIYRREYSEKGDNIYAAGLMHDIGIIIEDQFLHDEFTRVMRTLNRTRDDLTAVEDRVIGFDHTRLAREVTGSWTLPRELIDAIGYHHTPLQAPDGSTRIVKTLYVAEQIIQNLEIGFALESGRNSQLFHQTLEDLGIKEVAVEYISEEVREKIALMDEEGWFDDDN